MVEAPLTTLCFAPIAKNARLQVLYLPFLQTPSPVSPFPACPPWRATLTKTPGVAAPSANLCVLCASALSCLRSLRPQPCTNPT